MSVHRLKCDYRRQIFEFALTRNNTRKAGNKAEGDKVFIHHVKSNMQIIILQVMHLIRLFS